jgi:hypothetical protein
MGSVTYGMLCLSPTLVLALPPRRVVPVPREKGEEGVEADARTAADVAIEPVGL